MGSKKYGIGRIKLRLARLDPAPYSLLASMAIRMILLLNSGGSDPKLNFFLFVKTLRPIWSETVDESPWMALVIPIPMVSVGLAVSMPTHQCLHLHR